MPIHLRSPLPALFALTLALAATSCKPTPAGPAPTSTGSAAPPLPSAAAAARPAPHLVRPDVFDAIAALYSGEAAQENDRAIVEYHRIQGSPMMAEVAEKVVLAKLRAMGVQAELEQIPSDGRTRYQTFTSPMGWEMRSGELWVESAGGQKDFTPLRLCRYSDVPMCVSTYSKGGDWTGELVDVGAGTGDNDYEGKDVRGKVALAHGYAAAVVRAAVITRGALGVVIYPPPGDRPDHPDMVRYNGIWPRAEEIDKTSGGFQISQNQYTRLQGLMRGGPVRVHGTIDATLGPGRLTIVHARFRGVAEAGREVLVTAHLDHPKWSANDNASGSAAMIEMARTLKALSDKSGLPSLNRTIHLMWVPEYFGTVAYLTKHPEARACAAWDDPRLPDRGASFEGSGPCILANLNMDMVGEDTVKTGSRFYITRAPDSSARFLDALMADVLEQTREADLSAPTGTHNYWPAMMTPYAQGSDHDALIAIGVPGTMLGHDPDWTHHTSEDTPDKTDASEFRRVGVLATAAALWLGTAQEADWQALGRRSMAAMMAEYAARFGALRAEGSAAAKEREGLYLDVLGQIQAAMQKPASAGGRSPESLWEPRMSLLPSVKGPRRLTLALLDGSATADLPAEDKAWWQAQEERIRREAPHASFEKVVYEAMNFMDGKRDTEALARLVAGEMNVDLDRAFMDRLVGILAARGLVER